MAAETAAYHSSQNDSTGDADTLRISDDDHDQVKLSDDASHMSEENEIVEQGSSISESKRKHAEELNQSMEEDVQAGLLISKETYDHLRYEEEKIVQLRNAKDIRSLYELAEEIIIGERFEEELGEEEIGEEEEHVQPVAENPDDDNDEDAEEAQEQPQE